MKILGGITSTPIQSFTTRAPNGEVITITLRYMPTVQRWFMDLGYGDFSLSGYKIFRSQNILDKFINILPFGIMIDCNFEPFLIDDFESGRVRMYLLDSGEISQVD